jgi:hypothetical protein
MERQWLETNIPEGSATWDKGEAGYCSLCGDPCSFTYSLASRQHYPSLTTNPTHDYNQPYLHQSHNETFGKLKNIAGLIYFVPRNKMIFLCSWSAATVYFLPGLGAFSTMIFFADSNTFKILQHIFLKASPSHNTSLVLTPPLENCLGHLLPKKSSAACSDPWLSVACSEVNIHFPRANHHRAFPNQTLLWMKSTFRWIALAPASRELQNVFSLPAGKY